MVGLSATANVIAVIQLVGSIVKICGGYIQEVKHAQDDIITLQQTVAGLEGVLHKLKELLQDPHGTKLRTSSSLVNNISDCLSHLEALEEKIDIGRGKQMMKRLGIRALKWPLKRAEVGRIIGDLERYKSSFALSLHVDNTTILTGVALNIDQIGQNLGLDKLPIARGAEFDSYMDQHEDECLLGTRTELLRQITEWASSPQDKCMFWLNGKAGTGKSTICRTVAKSLKDAKILGASFFFKRGEGDRGNATKLFPTIARQLMISIPKLQPVVWNEIKDEPDLAGKSLREQFDRLLLQPLLRLDSAKEQAPTAVIVIDALDECENDKDIRVILQLLPQLRVPTALRVRLFLTSRDETPITLGFSEIANHHQDLALHEIPEVVTEHDISLFLKDRFAKIRDRRDVPSDWPGNEAFRKLLIMSVPLFICAATICRFLEDPKWDPEVRLVELLEGQAKYATKMEKTYLPILTRLLEDQDDDEADQLLQQFHEIVGTILLLAIPLSVNALSQLLRIRVGIISNLLNLFQSVLNIPSNQDIPVRILHLSFREFLVKSTSKFRVNEQQTHNTITKYCLGSMHSGLKRNICDLSSYGTERKEIDAQLIQQHLPPELQYSCRYWAYHLAQCKNPTAEMEDALLFLQKHFLHWIEAMSILGLASEVVGIINLLQSVLHRHENHELSEFLHDAKRFFLRNRQIASEVPLQIYYAGLVFAPRQAIIRKQFEAELPDWIRVLSHVQERWSTELQTIEGHSESVFSVVFSPDSRLLASGSYDNTIRLWDSATGALQQTLKAHSDSVRSVSFSRDGQLLASGSYDNTVRLWDTATGILQQTLKGHSGSVFAVAFSQDGQLLASSSSDKTIRFWDSATGTLQQTLEGHLSAVNSMSFSPNGRLLASGSSDKTIQLWDSATGALHQTLEGHSGSVFSLSFSPDGRLLASGSYDSTVRVWDSTTGVLQQTLEGHSGLVRSVSFSRDGQLLASSSSDKTIRLWDSTTGALQQTLKGHLDSVWSVSFSQDGQLLASGSSDKTVRLWDIATGILEQTLEGHSGSVNSMSFSPDGRLASGSYDNTARLWDSATGALQQTLKGHSGLVFSVAFSPDGRLLASGSYDSTVRLWDSATGVLQQTLEGHSGLVNLISFSPDGRLLASGSYDNTIRLWSSATGTPRQILKAHSDSVRSVSFSRDGQLLASGSYDNTVRLWDATTGTLKQTLEGHSGSIDSISFSRDGRLVASGSYDNTVRLWDTATGVPQQTLKGHSGSIFSVAFSQDGQLLASGSGDKTVRLWDTTTGALQQTLQVEGVVTDLEFSADCSYLKTNVGYLKIQILRDTTPPGLTRPETNMFLIEGQWVTLRREKALWLPPDYRPRCSAVNENSLALGHASGRVSIFKFCASCQG